MNRILAPFLGTAIVLCLTATATQAAVITCDYGTAVTPFSACTVNSGGGGGNGGTQGIDGGRTARFDFDPDLGGPFTVDYWVILEFAAIGGPTFSVTMEDIVPATPDLSNFPGHVCVPIFQLTSCVEFQVTGVSETPSSSSWLDSYDISVFWMADTENNGYPDAGGHIRLLHAEGIQGDDVYDSDITVEGSYSVCPPDCGPIEIDKAPGDPVITGSDDNFTRYTVTRVPEPASIFLLALGGAALYRRRR